MKLNKYSLALLFLLVFSALGVLLVIQYRILKKDIENNRTMMELAIPGILSDLYDVLMFNQDLRTYTDAYRGTGTFQFTKASTPTDPLHSLLKNRIDEVMSLNYPELDYTIDGFISGEVGCQIHRDHGHNMAKAEMVVQADNHMCFCMVLNNTLDISMTYGNAEEAALGNSANILKVSFLLILVIGGAFWYTIHTIRKQKKLSDLKRDFINNLTHEFKTPIFSISLAAKSIAEQANPKEKLTAYANLISGESKRLQAQVDKILQMALLDSGNLTLEKQTLDLHEAIENVVAAFRIIIEDKQGTITLDLKATRQQLVADETHLNNILFNLIDNAQKYTDGKPMIEVGTEDAKDGVMLTIKDHGIGMDAKTQQYIFDQFYRAERGDVHSVKGFGLGLSYVKKIVTFHRGDITLKSAPGQGSTFHIYLPQNA